MSEQLAINADGQLIEEITEECFLLAIQENVLEFETPTGTHVFMFVACPQTFQIGVFYPVTIPYQL